jgi:hypothetical protein
MRTGLYSSFGREIGPRRCSAGGSAFDPRKVIGVALNGAADTGHYSAYAYHYVTSPVMAAVG